MEGREAAPARTQLGIDGEQVPERSVAVFEAACRWFGGAACAIERRADRCAHRRCGSRGGFTGVHATAGAAHFHNGCYNIVHSRGRNRDRTLTPVRCVQAPAAAQCCRATLSRCTGGAPMVWAPVVPEDAGRTPAAATARTGTTAAARPGDPTPVADGVLHDRRLESRFVRVRARLFQAGSPGGDCAGISQCCCVWRMAFVPEWGA